MFGDGEGGPEGVLESADEAEEGLYEEEEGAVGLGERVHLSRSDEVMHANKRQKVSQASGVNAQTPRRVKIYSLSGNDKWNDLGTGNCSVHLDDAHKHAWIAVACEGPDDALRNWKTRLEPPFPTSGLQLNGGAEERCGRYTKQEDTLIVWCEEDGTDMALSFASAGGADEVWHFIHQVHAAWWDDYDAAHAMDSPAPDRPVSPASLASPPSHHSDLLPSPTLANLPAVLGILKTYNRTLAGREKLASIVLKTAFIERLIAVRDEAYELESLDDLWLCTTVLQTVILLNDHSILEYILKDSVIFGVVGILELDPDHPSSVASYTTHLKAASYVPIKPVPQLVLDKIHQTHRLQFLKDVVLAKVVEDPTYNLLNSLIFFNTVEIVEWVVEDEEYLPSVLSVFPDSFDDPGDKVEQVKALLFLQQLATMTKSLQMGPRIGAYRKMCELGLLRALEVAFANLVLYTESEEVDGHSESDIRAALFDILTLIVEHDPISFRRWTMLRHEKNQTTLMDRLVSLLTGKGLASEETGEITVVEAIRSLLCPPSSDPVEAAKASFINKSLSSSLSGSKDDPEIEAFFQYFYDNCVENLMSPLTSLTTAEDLDPDRIILLNHLCDLLVFCLNTHTFRSKYFILSSNISLKVAKLFQSKAKHLRLAALRFFRAALGRSDDFYNRYLLKNELFKPILDLTSEEKSNNGLLNSASLEFWEHIRTSNNKTLINSLFTAYAEQIQELAITLPTLAAFVRRHEMNNEPHPPTPATIPVKRLGRPLHSEEDAYFNESDEDEEMATEEPVSEPMERSSSTGFIGSPHPLRSTKSSANLASLSARKIDFSTGSSEAQRPGTPTLAMTNGLFQSAQGVTNPSTVTTSSVLSSLAAYGDDDSSSPISSDCVMVSPQAKEPSLPPLKRKVEEDDDDLLAGLPATKTARTTKPPPLPPSAPPDDKKKGFAGKLKISLFGNQGKK